MLQDYDIIFQTALAILSAIITGGFVLIYVELSNKKARETDNYEQLMRPFMHKLSAYFRFVSWCQTKIRIPREGLLGGEREFKKVLDELASYGGRAIISGGDYRVNSFSAEQLYNISTNKINHLWYLVDNEHSCNLEWDSTKYFNVDYIRKELYEINPQYRDLPITLDSFIKVSAEFHTEIYQMIEADTEIHETRMRLLKLHTRFTTVSMSSALLLLCSILLFNIPGWFIQIATIAILFCLFLCLLLVGTDYSVQVKWYNRITEITQNKTEKMKKVFSYRLLEPIGLTFLLAAFCWQNTSKEYLYVQQLIYQSNIDNVVIAAADLVASQAFRDTANYKGEMISNYNPEAVYKATSQIYTDQARLLELTDQHRKYYFWQIISYVLGSVFIVIEKTISAIKNSKE